MIAALVNNMGQFEILAHKAKMANQRFNQTCIPIIKDDGFQCLTKPQTRRICLFTGSTDQQINHDPGGVACMSVPAYFP